MGVAGAGTSHHLSVLLLAREAGIDIVQVPYKGGAPMIVDAAGGHVDAVITTLPVGGPMVDAGKLRWIATVQPTVIESLPGIPSLSSALKEITIPSWIGIFTTIATSQSDIQLMHDAVTKSANSHFAVKKLRENGLEPLNLSLTDTKEKVANEAAFMRNFLESIDLDFAT